MEKILSILEQMKKILYDIKQSKRDMTPPQEKALNQDLSFIEGSIDTVKNGSPEEIHQLWKKMQQMSKFFGADYTGAKGESQLVSLFEDLLKVLLKKK